MFMVGDGENSLYVGCGKHGARMWVKIFLGHPQTQLFTKKLSPNFKHERRQLFTHKQTI
jgi:hypothetical protein